MKRLKNIIVSTLACALLAISTSACSVVLAAGGSEDPELSKVRVGASKSVIDEELGEPSTFEPKGGGFSAVYVYKVGDAPAPGRAVMNLVLDIFTICLWEYIAFPLEISAGGNAYERIVTYNKDLIATAVGEAK